MSRRASRCGLLDNSSEHLLLSPTSLTTLHSILPSSSSTSTLPRSLFSSLDGMSEEMTVLHTVGSSNENKEDKSNNDEVMTKVSMCMDNTAVLLGNIPTPTHLKRNSSSARRAHRRSSHSDNSSNSSISIENNENSSNSSSSSSIDARVYSGALSISDSTNDKNDESAESDRKTNEQIHNGCLVVNESKSVQVVPGEVKKDVFAAARGKVSLAEMWAVEFAQMSAEDQKRLHQSILPKRTKQQEAQRTKDREEAGISSFRRLSFDFIPLEGDEVPRFAHVGSSCSNGSSSGSENGQESGVEEKKIDFAVMFGKHEQEEKKRILSDVSVVSSGKLETEETQETDPRSSNNPRHQLSKLFKGCCMSRKSKKLASKQREIDQKVLTEKLGKLTKEELNSLEETKAYYHFDFYRNYIQIVSMFKPVLLICLLIFVYVHLIRIPWSRSHTLVVWTILFYNPLPTDTLGEEVVGSLYNGLLVLLFVVVATLLYVVLLFLKARESLRHVLQVLNIFLLGGPCGYFIYQLIVLYSIPFDVLTFIGCVWNIVGVGWFALNYNGNSKTFLTRGFLILLATCMAWPFIEFPEPSVWATLGLLVVYDLFAVLAPCGPLRYIMEAEAKLKREGKESKPLPGLVYRGHFFIVGLGDLVFYGALMGQASVPGWQTALGCLIGILMGVAGTILWTTSSGKVATPALPMSAVLGLFLRLVVPAFVLPMLQSLSLHSLVV